MSETALSTINTLPSNKTEVQKFFRMLKDEILANDRDPLKILVQLKMAERLIDNILKDKDLDDHFLREFTLFEKEKVIQVNGAELRAGETGVKYEYEKSGDPVWFDLQKQVNELTEKKKEREKFLQNIPYDAGIVDPGSGVFITKPPKSSHSKVIVKL